MIKEKVKTVEEYKFLVKKQKEEEFPVIAGTSRYDSPDYPFSLYFDRKIKHKFYVF